MKFLNMTAALIGAALAAACGFGAHAQSFTGTINSGYVYGNAGSQAAKPQGATVTSIFDRALASTRGAIIERGSSGWAAVGPGSTTGLPWVSNGTGADPAYQVLGISGGGTGATTAIAALQSLGAYANQYTNSGTATLGASQVGKIIGDTAPGQTFTLPGAASFGSQLFVPLHQQSGSLTIARSGSDLIYGPNNWGVASLTLASLGEWVVLFSDGGNWHVINGSANFIGAPSGKVIVQRVTNPSFESSTWMAFGPSGNLLCTPATGSSTSCLHEADNAAFPYTLGNTAPGYDLEIRGGADPAQNGSHYSGAAVLIPMSAAWTLNPMQGGKIIAHGLTFNCNITIDSLEYSQIDFEGSQTSACVAGDARNGFVINPTHPSPLDLITAVGPGRIFVQSVNGGVHITGAMMQNEVFEVSELNVSGIFASGCVYQNDTATAGANFTGNRIIIDFLHGLGAGMTGMCVGTAPESGGNVNGRNKYTIGISGSNSSTNGIDTYGHDDQWNISADGAGSMGYIIKFESGSCRNVVTINIQGTAPATPVVDSSGCTGANANVVTINGSITAGKYVLTGGGTWARYLVTLRGVNFNSANTDNAVTIPLPAGVTNYHLTAMWLSNASASISTATVGLFTGTGGTGTAIASNQAITVTSGTSGTNNNLQAVTLNNGNTEWYNNATLQVRVGTAQGSAATADVLLEISPL